MSWLSTAWEGIKQFGGVVANVARKAWDVATGPSAKQAYDDMEELLDRYSRVKSKAPVTDSPDFFGGLSADVVESKFEDYEKKLVDQQSELNHAKKFMAIQNEFSRLRGSAELLDRSMSNIKIHASSLSTHFQNMRNIHGLTDDVNALRGALKLIMKTFNHNMNVMGAQEENSKLVKIQGVDVDLKDGAVSMVAALDAFDRTRQLLSDEIAELSDIASRHMTDLNRLKRNASTLEGELGKQVISFIEQKIYPVIEKANNASYILQDEVKRIPIAERDENGRFIFVDNKIKFKDAAGV